MCRGDAGRCIPAQHGIHSAHFFQRIYLTTGLLLVHFCRAALCSCATLVSSLFCFTSLRSDVDETQLDISVITGLPLPFTIPFTTVLDARLKALCRLLRDESGLLPLSPQLVSIGKSVARTLYGLYGVVLVTYMFFSSLKGVS